jgi:RNA polymerase sigma factor FliA
MTITPTTAWEDWGKLIAAIAWQCYRKPYPQQDAQEPYEQARARVAEWIQVGWVALLAEVVPRYDPDKGTLPSTYATYRVRGAILDYLTHDRVIRVPREHLSEIERDQWQEIVRFRSLWCAEHGAEPSPEETAAHFGIPCEELLRLCHKMRSKKPHLAPLDVRPLHDPRPNPETATMTQQLQWQLTHCIKALPEELQTIVLLYYWQELTLRQVGSIMEISKDTVAERLQRAIARLRKCVTTAGFPWQEVDLSASAEDDVRETQPLQYTVTGRR